MKTARWILVLGLLGQVATAAQQKSKPSALCEAAHGGDAAEVRRLLADGADIEAPAMDRTTPLMWAAKMGRAEIVELLLAAGAQVNHAEQGWTALRWAAAGGAPSIARRLLEAGAHPDDEDARAYGTTMHLAARNDSAELIELLAAAGAAADERSEGLRCCPLHVATWLGHASTVRALLARGARLDSRDELGRTALHLAAYRGHEALVEALLAAGAEVDARDDLGRTPLHLAALAGHERVLQRLRDAGDPRWEDVKRRLALVDHHGWSALHWAAASGDARCLATLQADLDLDARTDTGRTALHWAVLSGDPARIGWLLGHGASPEVRDACGFLPRDLLTGGLDARLLIALGVDEPPLADGGPLRALLAQPSGRASVVVALHGGYPGPGGSVSGLELAAWTDGLVLFAPHAARPGENLRVGQVPPARVASVLAECAGLGMFDHPWRDQVAMHAGSTSITLTRDGKTQVLTWDGSIEEGAWFPSSAARSLQDAWSLMDSLLGSLVPSGALEAGEWATEGRLREFKVR